MQYSSQKKDRDLIAFSCDQSKEQCILGDWWNVRKMFSTFEQGVLTRPQPIYHSSKRERKSRVESWLGGWLAEQVLFLKKTTENVRPLWLPRGKA